MIISKNSSARTLKCLLSIFVVLSSISCRQTVPDTDTNYLSTISGQVLSNCPDQPEKLCIIGVGKDRNVEIRNDLLENIMSLALAPNGLVFAQAKIDHSTSTSTIRIEDTGQTSKIREIVQGGFVGDLSWSANGTYLAYEIFTPDSNDDYCSHLLFVQHLANSNFSLEPFEKCVLDYAWSPVDNEIVYSLRAEEGNRVETGLYKTNVETGEFSILIEPKDELVHMSVQWSPDGQNISFVEGIGPMESTGYLVVINASTAEELYRVVPEECAWLSLERLCYTWSPDSAKVAFIKSTNSASHFYLEDLYLLDVETGKIEQITHTENYAIDDNFDVLGIKLGYPLWIDSSTITLFWTQDKRDYLVVTDTNKDNLSLIAEYERIPQFYQLFQ